MSLLARAICKVRTHHSPRQSRPAKVDPSRPRAAAVHRQEPPPITSPDSHISCRAFICLPLAVPDRSRPLKSTRCLQDRFFFPLCFGSAPKSERPRTLSARAEHEPARGRSPYALYTHQSMPAIPSDWTRSNQYQHRNDTKNVA